MQYSYYPGCTLHSSAKEFDHSTIEVAEALDIELIELKDWNCCGATSAHSSSEKLTLALPARNIFLAEREGRDLIVPCAACYNRVKYSQVILQDDPELRQELKELFSGGNGKESIEAMHLLEIFRDENLVAKVREKTTNPLKDLKAVCYYGCLLVRPPKLLNFDDPENPQIMDTLMEAIGVTVLDWSYKVDCCGAGLSLTRPEVIAELVGTLLRMAEDAGGECIITACPMCHANLDMKQESVNQQLESEFNIPIFYFTELMGIAFGISKAESWVEKHFVDALLDDVHSQSHIDVIWTSGATGSTVCTQPDH